LLFLTVHQAAISHGNICSEGDVVESRL